MLDLSIVFCMFTRGYIPLIPHWITINPINIPLNHYKSHKITIIHYQFPLISHWISSQTVSLPGRVSFTQIIVFHIWATVEERPCTRVSQRTLYGCVSTGKTWKKNTTTRPPKKIAEDILQRYSKYLGKIDFGFGVETLGIHNLSPSPPAPPTAENRGRDIQSCAGARHVKSWCNLVSSTRPGMHV